MEYIEINPTSSPTHTIIWLHGLGADGHDFEPMAQELVFPASIQIRYLFPHAPIIPITINNGYKMRGWFDIYDLTRLQHFDEIGISQSVDGISQLIQQEINRGIPSNHIILAGFSQGAVIALTAGLTVSSPLAGIIALSGYLPNAEKVLEKRNLANHDIPIFLAHGTRDAVVPFTLGELTLQALRQAQLPITWRSYSMEHSVCKEEIVDINHWLLQQLTKNEGQTTGK